MRILIDECVDWRLLRNLPNHEVKTVRQMGWSETVNGALLVLAEEYFDVLVTTTRISLFSKRRTLQIAVVVLRARSARLRHLREQVSALLTALPDVKSGEVHTLRGGISRDFYDAPNAARISGESSLFTCRMD